MHHPTDRITHTTAFVTPVVEDWLEQEIAQRVHPMKNRSDDPSHHERMLLPRSYILLPQNIKIEEVIFFVDVLDARTSGQLFMRSSVNLSRKHSTSSVIIFMAFDWVSIHSAVIVFWNNKLNYYVSVNMKYILWLYTRQSSFSETMN